MSSEQFETVPLWVPGPHHGRGCKELQKYIEEKYGQTFEDYFAFHKWSVENLAVFYAELWERSGIIFSKAYHQVIDISIPMDECPKWFEGARLNFAENTLRYRDDHLAMIATGETAATERFTYKQLYKEVSLYAAAFRKAGLQKGDRVACYMSNRKEAVFAGLATTSIGAIFTGGLPLLGPQAYLNRVKQVDPKFLITVDKFPHNKETKHLLKNIQEISKGLPSLVKLIIVPSDCSLSQEDITSISKSCLLEDFLLQGYEADGSVPEMTFEQVSVSHPVFISYTSGTTGLPKTLVHGAGILLSSYRDLCIHKDAGGREEKWLLHSPVGWATWNFGCFMLFIGHTLVLFEGIPFLITPTFLWDLVDHLGISRIFLTPSLLDEMENSGFLPTPKHHLSSLKVVNCGTSVVKPRQFELILKRLKKGLTMSTMYACTETMGSLATLDDILPVYSGELACPSLGVAIAVVNDAGMPVLGEPGEIVLTASTPSLSLGFWNDTNGQAFKEVYFSHFKGKFFIGDSGIINPITKGIIIRGRSDEVIKARGCRFGSSEIYNVVETIPEIEDSLCTSQFNKARDERAVLFLKMKDGQKLSGDLVGRIREKIAEELTARHVPEVIVEAPGILRNFNGKKMESLAKKIINDLPYNAEIISNPDCIDFYRSFPKF